MKNQILLYQLQRLMETMPDFAAYEPDSPAHARWMGSAYAVVYQWMPFPAISIASAIEFMPVKAERNKNIERILNVMSHALSELESAVAHEPAAEVVKLSQADFEKALSTLMLTTHDNVFITDKLIDAEVLQRYLGQLEGMVHVRLLASTCSDEVRNAIAAIDSPSGLKIEIRTDPGVQDRLIYIDALSCWSLAEPVNQAEEKTTASLAPLATDLATDKRNQYERLWAQAKVIA